MVVAVVGLLAGIFLSNRPSTSPEAGGYPFDVGTPGQGEPAPAFRLDSTGGGTWGTPDADGKTVLLFFQEGTMCQPCWDQMRDIEANWDAFSALGIDDMVTITIDPIDVLNEKVAAEGLSTTTLSDPGLAASKAYGTNIYGMHGDANNGHSFIVVGPDGIIRWRADYGGPPDFTMYVPTNNLLADLRAGLEGA